MYEITISTPALVFPALSVLMLAYTNRFIAISKRVRSLHAEHKNKPHRNLRDQIKSLHRRLRFIRNMQFFAITGFLINMVSIFMILVGLAKVATVLFGLSLICIIASLIISIMEINMSVQAMTIELAEDAKDF